MTTTTIERPPAVTVDPNIDPDPRTRLNAIAAAVRNEVVALDDIIELMLLAFVSRSNLFLIGAPGVGKSFLPDRFMLRIAATKFKILVGRTTTDSDILGPLDVPGLAEGRHRRKPDGYMPTAHLAVFDEVFKMGTAGRDMLLWAFNEGEWRQDGQVLGLPLNLVCGMSNEGPQGDEDAAFYDRFLLRGHQADNLDRDDLDRLLRLPTPDPAPPALLTFDDLLAIQAQAAALPLTDGAVEALKDVHAALTDAQMRPSPRRFLAATRVVRAAAWLADATEARSEHVTSTMHVFWPEPDMIPTVKSIVLGVCSPGRKEAEDLLDRLPPIQQMVAALEAETDATAKHQLFLDIFDQMRPAAAATLEVEAAGAPGAVDTLARVRATIDDLVTRSTQSTYGIGGDLAEFWAKATQGGAA